MCPVKELRTIPMRLFVMTVMVTGACIAERKDKGEEQGAEKATEKFELGGAMGLGWGKGGGEQERSWLVVETEGVVEDDFSTMAEEGHPNKVKNASMVRGRSEWQ